MNGQELRDGFHLHDDAALDYEIEPITAWNAQALVDEGQTPLVLEAHSAKRELVREAQAVCGFEQTGAQLTMDLDACADDLLGHIDMGGRNFHARVIDVRWCALRDLLPASPSPRLPVNGPMFYAAAAMSTSTAARILSNELGVQSNGCAISFQSVMKAPSFAARSSRLAKCGSDSRLRWRIENHCSI
jgi:hypothetical protein